MTDLDEKNLRVGISNLIDVAAKATRDSRYYVARLAESLCRDICVDELRKSTSNDGSK